MIFHYLSAMHFRSPAAANSSVCNPSSWPALPLKADLVPRTGSQVPQIGLARSTDMAAGAAGLHAARERLHMKVKACKAIIVPDLSTRAEPANMYPGTIGRR